MPFAWSEYLDLAKELAGVATRPRKTEADPRCAISRAYYAAFCSARNLLRTKDRVAIPPGVQVHDFVIRSFQSHADLVRRGIGANLDRLRTARNRADYDDHVPQVGLFVPLALGWADQILADLQKL